MDLHSYINLKETYKTMNAPQAEVVSEEENLDEVWGDAFNSRQKEKPLPSNPAPKAPNAGAGALGTTGDALGGRIAPAKNKPASSGSSSEPKRAGTKSWADRLNARR